MTALTENNCKDIFQSIDNVLLDCDGVIWQGSEPIPGVIDTIEKLKSMGKQVVYVTNNSTKSLRAYAQKFEKLGFKIKDDEIFAPSTCAAKYLKENGFKGSAYVIGSTGIQVELENIGIKCSGLGPDPMNTGDLASYIQNDLHLADDVGAVVMGFDPYIGFPKYVKACSYLKRNPNCHFIITNQDRMFPTDSGTILPGTGSLISPVITACDRAPVVIGKPNTYMFNAIRDIHKIDPKRSIMIGDNLETDILFGVNNNIKHTVLVLSGVSQLTDVHNFEQSNKEEDKKLIPSYYIDNLGSLGKLL